MMPVDELYTDDIKGYDDDNKRAIIEQEAPEALLVNGFDDALIGIAYRCGQSPIAVYDKSRCVDILMRRDGMDYTDAVEYVEVNIIGAWMDDGTPVFVELF